MQKQGFKCIIDVGSRPYSALRAIVDCLDRKVLFDDWRKIDIQAMQSVHVVRGDGSINTYSPVTNVP